jgi:hypothetical protein
MSRSPILIAFALFAVALLAVPAALASGGHHRTVRVQGTCTQQSTSKLKLSREDRRIEVEFEVDQNRDGVPWKGVLRRNGRVVASFRAATHAPSGSFEIRRVIAGRLADRITAVASRASGETCTARSSASSAQSALPANTVDDNGAHDVGDDHGHDGSGHA